MQTKEDSPSFNFEQSMKEIDSIVNAIEKGEISLDESIKQYERGSRLIRLCQEFLERKNKQLEDISTQAKTSTPASNSQDPY